MQPKLVRDRIPDLIENAGEKPIIRYLQDHERLPVLQQKLAEEYAELQADWVIDEIIDMIEVLLAISRALGVSEARTLDHLYAKRSERGGFERGIILLDIEKDLSTS